MPPTFTAKGSGVKSNCAALYTAEYRVIAAARNAHIERIAAHV